MPAAERRLAATTRRPGLLRRALRALRGVLGVPGRKRRRRRQEERLRIVGRVAARPGLPADSRRFLEAALSRQAAVVERLQALEVADDLFLDWREGVLAALEREAGRARRLERVRARLRGPLPTSVVEERLLQRVAEHHGAADADVEGARSSLIGELDKLLEELQVPTAPRLRP